MVYDGTCVTAVHHDRLRPLASGKRLATDYAEATKRKAKAAAWKRGSGSMSLYEHRLPD